MGDTTIFDSAGQSIGNSIGRLGPRLDVRGEGGFVVGPGSVHANGKPYLFEVGSGPDEVKIANFPDGLLRVLKAKPRSVSTKVPANDLTPKQKKRCIRYVDAVLSRELDRLEKSVEHQRNDNLNFVAYRLGQVSRWGDLDYASTGKKLTSIARQIGLDAAEIQPTIDSGWNAGRASRWAPPFLRNGAASVHAHPSPDQQLTAKLALLGETDADNAGRLLARCGRKLLHAPGAGWLVFDGRRWAPDLLDKRHKLAWETSRLIGKEPRFIAESGAAAGRAKFAKDCLSKAAVDRMLESAKHLLVVADERLDACPWLLNVANGTIDLRTGFRYKHDHRDLITHLIPVRYSSKAKCPRFKAFLRFATHGDNELSAFIHRAAGYSITGDTKEQVFFFLYGEGATGKSTLMNAIRELLGT
jgi:putative DNA primase/helicase